MAKRANDRIMISYGSNMSARQMAYRCPGAAIIGKATLDGWRLTFQGNVDHAHANIIPEEGASTPVVVWAINAEHEAALDRYEGVAGGYYRQYHIPVTVNGKTHRRALVYLMSRRPYNIPATSYLNGIADAYKTAGFNTDPLYDALRYAAEHFGDFPEYYNKEDAIR